MSLISNYVMVLSFILSELLIIAFVFFVAYKHSLKNRKLTKLIKAVQEDVNALCSGATGVGWHLSRIDQRLARLIERQDQLDLHDPVNNTYDNAIKLIREGVSMNDVMKLCSLGKDEAELLYTLHGNSHNINTYHTAA